MRISNKERALLDSWRMGFISIHELRRKLGDERYEQINPTNSRRK